MIFLSYFVAFIGGVLTLLPACGPALLPAFFAYTFRQKIRLLEAVVFFGLGFSLLFLPFGLGVHALANLLTGSHELISTVVGVVLIAFGLLSIFGLRIPVWFTRSEHRNSAVPADAFGLGLIFGFTSAACSAPIFGAIATLAAAQVNRAGVLGLLVMFELGLLVPLFVLAILFERYKVLQWSWLKGTGIQFLFAGRVIKLYTANLISGLLFIIIGIVFVSNKVNAVVHSAMRGSHFENGAYEANISLIQFNLAHPLASKVLSAGLIIGILLLVTLSFRAFRRRTK